LRPVRIKNGTMTTSDIQDDNKVIREVEVINKMGLHARPAMQLVDTANQFSSEIKICKGEQSVDGKSIMEVLLLAAAKGTILAIHAEGDDAQDAAAALVKLVQDKFGEE